LFFVMAERPSSVAAAIWEKWPTNRNPSSAYLTLNKPKAAAVNCNALLEDRIKRAYMGS
jgi:hypothetical protein